MSLYGVEKVYEFPYTSPSVIFMHNSYPGKHLSRGFVEIRMFSI